MSSENYNLYFNGYWREPNIGGLPANSGIYCVYGCVYDSAKGEVSISKLIYIGESHNVQNRVANHEKWDEWRRKLMSGEQLCFNAALIGGEADRQQAEAAMIHKHKPPCNSKYVDTFPYDQTTIRTSGQNARLHKYFTVHPTSSQGLMGIGYSGRSQW